MAESDMLTGYLMGDNNTNDGWGNGNGGWWWIIIIALLFGWGGFGGGYGMMGGGAGAQANYVLTSDFSQLSRQLADSTAMTERKLDSVTNGLSSVGYENLNNFCNLNSNIAQRSFDAAMLAVQNQNALTAQLNQMSAQTATCCCDIGRQIERGFADVGYAMATNTSGIIQSTHNDTDRVIAKLDAMEAARQAEKIATLQAENTNLKFAASQANQNAFIAQSQQTAVDQILDKLSPCPRPCYLTCNPNAPINYSVNYGGCGCGA